MMIVRGSTKHFTVSYDSSLTNGTAFADAILAKCEQDLAELSALFGGIMPAAASLPFQINCVPGGAGAGHPGCLSTVITLNCGDIANDPSAAPSIVDAEVTEVFEATQALGWNCGYSNGEGLSRVGATLMYPCRRWLFSPGWQWLDARTSPSLPDWVTNTKQTDRDDISSGCASLFLNYLAFEKNFTWQQIISASAPTLLQTATNLGLTNEPNAFFTLLANQFPVGTPVQSKWQAGIKDDDPFPFSVPSLYMRHNLCDDGTSHVGPLAHSPDIIMKNNPITNPQGTFSTTASINSDTESDPFVLDGQDNYVYLRVWNRGIDTTNVTATVYWSPPATLVTPSMWNLIGSAMFADVPQAQFIGSPSPPLVAQASNVQVSNPGVTWPQGNIPGPGHYCFVATVGNSVEPAPSPTTFTNFQGYVNYILAHNNITWRNFNVIAVLSMMKEGPFVGFVPLPAIS
jgi:hypothetical protein